MTKALPRGKSPKKAKPHHLTVYVSEDDRAAWSQSAGQNAHSQKLLIKLIHKAFAENGIPFKDD